MATPAAGNNILLLIFLSVSFFIFSSPAQEELRRPTAREYRANSTREILFRAALLERTTSQTLRAFA
jgi:hypothetical protein